MIEETYELVAKGEEGDEGFNKIRLISFFISASIVLFNKFVLGIVFHKIVDLEKISTKSRFNISFA